jgi:hypothetical protein
MEARKTPLLDGDGLGDQACVAVDLALLAGQTPAGPGCDVAGKTTHTNLDEIIQQISTLLTFVGEGALLLHSDARPASCLPPPPAGDRECNSSAGWRSTRHASPSSGVAGLPAGPAGCQLTHTSPRPPTSLVSHCHVGERGQRWHVRKLGRTSLPHTCRIHRRFSSAV